MKKYTTIVTAVDCKINNEKGVAKISKGDNSMEYATMQSIAKAWNRSFDWLIWHNPNCKKMTVTVTFE